MMIQAGLRGSLMFESEHIARASRVAKVVTLSSILPVYKQHVKSDRNIWQSCPSLFNPQDPCYSKYSPRASFVTSPGCCLEMQNLGPVAPNLQNQNQNFPKIPR